MPIILSGHWTATDEEKDERWAQTVSWAERNGCTSLLAATPRRLGKRGSVRSLSAAEYAAETGTSLYVRLDDPSKGSPREHGSDGDA